MKRGLFIGPRRGVGRAVLASLLALVALGGAFSVGADEEEKLIPLKEAGNIPNSALLLGSVNRFENNAIPVPYPVYVVDTEEVNAWADGSKVVFYRGLLDFVESEGEVGYVLGHEMSHNIGRHPRKQTYGIIGLVLVNAALSNDYQYQPGRELDFERAQLAQNITIYLLAVSYGRTHEYDADRYGVYLMVDAGYDPNDAIKFQERLLKKSPESPSLFANLLSTHPTSENRIQQIRSIIGNDLYQDEKGNWRRRGEPLHQGPKRNTSSQRVRRGMRLAVITGGVSLLAAALEQSALESDGVVNSDQRQHNTWVAVRNGVLLGFLTGSLLIVDVPGTRPPALADGSSGPSSQPIILRYNPGEERWEMSKTFRF